ncbi:hypothetical protein GGR55DRAFT_632017 [Xylaria sp. FL0064]|nr:hypothetical protein GGR55DRAFT_632017 [Xylaria sp. FL0064]
MFRFLSTSIYLLLFPSSCHCHSLVPYIHASTSIHASFNTCMSFHIHLYTISDRSCFVQSLGCIPKPVLFLSSLVAGMDKDDFNQFILMELPRENKKKTQKRPPLVVGVARKP